MDTLKQYTDDQLKYALAQKEVLVHWLLQQRDNERASMEIIANELKRRSDNAGSATEKESSEPVQQEPETK